MIGNAFLTFYRVATRRPLYAALDLLGLSFGVAVFVTLSLYVRFETSFERWLPDSGQIYLAQTRYTMPGKPTRAMDVSTAMLLETLKTDYPDLVGVRIHETEADIRKNGASSRERETLVDADFFKLFDLPLIAGDKVTALSSPGTVLLSEAMAHKYLPHGDGVGATIRLGDSEGENTYVVAGILADLPRNTDLRFDIVRLMTPAFIAAQSRWDDWGRLSVGTYLRFGDKAPADRQDAAFDDFVDRHLGERENGQPMHSLFTYRLMPLRSLHLSDPRSRSALLTLGLVALLSLIVAAINHVNLATALAALRAREVAVRRTVGGTRGALARQFLVEAMLNSLLAWIGGLSLVEVGLPSFNEVTGLYLSLSYGADGSFFGGMMAAVLLLGLLSGAYPAFVLSRFQPALVLASARSPSGGRVGLWVREALVVLQFTVVVVFFTVTWGFFSQIDYLKAADLGFRRETLLLTESSRNPAMTAALLHQVWAAWREVPGVISIGAGQESPAAEKAHSHVALAASERPDVQVSGFRCAVDGDFFAAYGAKLLAGRFVDPLLAEDREPTDGAALHVVLSSRMASSLGFATPEQAVGQRLVMYTKPLQVVGVVGDLRFDSPKTELEGVYYYAASTNPDLRQATAIRYEGVSEPELRRRLNEVWRSIAPDVPLDLISAEESLDKYYRPDRIRSRLFAIGAAGAALIGCLGLYGMATFGVSRRMLELAIRKVLGATRGTVVRLLVVRSLRPVLLANLLAAPIAYWVVAQWLVQFEDRIAITPVPFLAAAGAALAVALGTVFSLSFASASRAPAQALRHE
jgi:putative ABC transport system permease protein